MNLHETDHVAHSRHLVNALKLSAKAEANGKTWVSAGFLTRIVAELDAALGGDCSDGCLAGLDE